MGPSWSPQARHATYGIRKCFLFLLQCQLMLVIIQVSWARRALPSTCSIAHPASVEHPVGRCGTPGTLRFCPHWTLLSASIGLTSFLCPYRTLLSIPNGLASFLCSHWVHIASPYQFLACLVQLPPILSTTDILWLSCFCFPLLR